MDRRVRVDRDARDGLELELLRPAEACCPGRRDVLRSLDAHRNQDELRVRQDHRLQSRDVHRGRQDLLRDHLGRCGWGALGDVRQAPSDASRDHPDHRIHQDHYRGEDARRSDGEPHQEPLRELSSWGEGRFVASQRDVPALRGPLGLLELLQAQELPRRSRQRRLVLELAPV